MLSQEKHQGNVYIIRGKGKKKGASPDRVLPTVVSIESETKYNMQKVLPNNLKIDIARSGSCVY